MVAAIVSPYSTNMSVSRIVAPALVKSEPERIYLWHDILMTPWTWVNPYPPQGSLLFERTLVKLAAEDGYKIRLLTVAGGGDLVVETPEHNTCKVGAYQRPDMVISDGFQSFTFASDPPSPIPLPDYQAWVKLNWLDVQLLERIKKRKLDVSKILRLLYRVKYEALMHCPEPLKDAELQALTKMLARRWSFLGSY